MKYIKYFNRINFFIWTAVSIILLCSVLPDTAEADSQFKPAVNYIAGDKPISVAMADLDRDSNLDLAVANQKSGDVSILMGNGDGTFQDALNFLVPGDHLQGGLEQDWLSSLAIEDLNGDGKLDLAISRAWVGKYCEFDGIYMLLGNGDGTFQEGVKIIDTEGCIPSLAIEDLNSDGDMDLVAVDIYYYYGGEGDYSSIFVKLGNGNGTFQEAVQVDPYFSDPEHFYYSVVIADFNGDNKHDLATDNVSVLLGNGDGTFQEALTFPASGNAIAVGDLNGDDKPDLATSGVSVLLGNGDGTFQEALTFPASGSAIAVGDLNGDGKMDLVTANSVNDTVSVWSGNGDGTFQDAVNYSTGDQPHFIAIGDLNRDGASDLVVATGSNVSVFINIQDKSGNGGSDRSVDSSSGGSGGCFVGSIMEP
jgi:hypothetical protein